MIKTRFGYLKLAALGAVVVVALISSVGRSTATISSPEPLATAAVPFDDVCGGENAKAVADLYKNWSAECIKEIGANPPADPNTRTQLCLAADKFNKMLPKLKALAANGPFTIGPRDLMVGTSQNGDIVNPGFRTFLSPSPLDKDSLTVEVNKTDGKAGALVYICKIDENKHYTHLKNIAFDEGNNTATKKETVSGVKGSIVQVFINGNGGVAKAFKYTLKTSQ
jgi:hypothetical protein